MPVELRKRKAAPPPPPPAKKRAPSKPKAAKKEAPKTEEKVVVAEDAPVAAPAAKAEDTKSDAPKSAPKVGDSLTLDGFGGEIEDNDGKKVTLAKLVADSKAGVVLFTYPKASTPGCTKQACLFRDAYGPLTAAGLSIYGLSTDSPKSNTTFKTKQNLQYPLLCDPNATLIAAIGLKKPPKSTTRGVFVVDKSGKVLAAQPGSPDETVQVVKKVIAALGGDAGDDGVKKAEATAKSDAAVAQTAADVADTAQKLDGPKI